MPLEDNIKAHFCQSLSDLARTSDFGVVLGFGSVMSPHDKQVGYVPDVITISLRETTIAYYTAYHVKLLYSMLDVLKQLTAIDTGSSIHENGRLHSRRIPAAIK